MIFDVINGSLSRHPEESELAYIYRLGKLKDDGIIDLTWAELADVLNKALRDEDEYWSESAYRKKYSLLKQGYEEVFKNICGNQDSDQDSAQELINLRRELEKEKVKFRDERNEYNKLIRMEARKESYQDQFIRSICEATSALPLLYNSKEIEKSDSSLVISLTDIHCGINSKNFWNTYNTDVLKERLEKYLNRIEEIQDRHNADSAYLIISEALSGLIKPELRIQNNQDLIDQFLVVSEYLSGFIAALSSMFRSVDVYVAPGNHSRITANKEDGLSHENLDNLLIPFLSAKLQLYSNVNFHNNSIEHSIAIFNVRGKTIAAIHGDKDTMSNAAENLRKLTGVSFDLIFTSHMHTNAFRTESDCKIIQSGTIAGTDAYAVDHRLRNRPEQTVCVLTDHDGLDCIYDVKF